MKGNLKYRVIFIVAVLLVCVYGIIGIPKSGEDLVANWKKNIRLGLDLRGGSHLVLQVQLQDAFKGEADNTIDRLKEDLRKGAIDYTALDRNDPQALADADKIQINIKGIPEVKSSAFRSLISERYTQWMLTPVNATDYRMNISTTEALAIKRDTVRRSMDVIENRINGLGLAEATVQQRGRTDAEAEILVQMPGVDDPARVKAMLQTAAILEVVDVKDGPFPTQEAGLAKHGGVLPLNTKMLKFPRRGPNGDDSWYLVGRTPILRGTDIRTARPGRDEFGKWETNFTLTQDAGIRFGRYTEANIGNRLGIALDQQLASVATIQSRIPDSGRITGQANEQEAVDLSIKLRAGSLPAGITSLEERSIGPSLGADSIREGIIAGLVGLIAVVMVMLFYYRRAGVNATLALVLNAIILLACLAYFEAVLTLPGIAGVILTIGMAVDSNVLIFERIREELHAGKAVVSAVDTGFSRAFLTIIDTTSPPWFPARSCSSSEPARSRASRSPW